MEYIGKFRKWIDEAKANIGKDRWNSVYGPSLEQIITQITMLVLAYERPSKLAEENIERATHFFLLEYLDSGFRKSMKHFMVANLIRQAFDYNSHFAKSQAWWLDFDIKYDSFWPEAIQIAFNYVDQMGDNSMTHEIHSYPYLESARRLVDAAVFLRSKGFKISLDHTGMGTSSEREAIACHLDKSISKIGGFFVVEEIMHVLYGMNKFTSRASDNWMERVIFTENKRFPLPVSYLLNLGVKHIKDSSPGKSATPEKIPELIDIAGAFSALYNVLDFHSEKRRVMVPNEILDWLPKNALFHQLYVPVEFPLQRIPHFLKHVLSHILPKLSDDQVKNLGYEPFQVIRVIENLLELAKDKGSLAIFSEKHLKERCAFVSAAHFEMIMKMLSRAFSLVNDSYLLPEDKDHNFWDRPLISFGHGNYLLINHDCSSLNFYEAVIADLRRVATNSIQDDLGPILEEFVVNSFRSKGIPCFKLTPEDMPELDGDIDAIVVSDSCVTIFEIKAKAFTRAAKAGDDWEIIVDLLAGLMHSQLQLLSRLARLLKSGIVLKAPNNETKPIELKNRRINLVSLILHSFGSFHDKNIWLLMLKLFAGCRFGLADSCISKRDEKKLKCANSDASRAIDLEREFLNLRVTHNNIHRYFICLRQLEDILTSVNNADEFHEAFARIG